MNSQHVLMKSLMHEEVGALRKLMQDREKMWSAISILPLLSNAADVLKLIWFYYYYYIILYLVYRFAQRTGCQLL